MKPDDDEMNPNGLIRILTELRDLLLEYDYMGHATVVSDLLDLAHLESPKFVSRLQGGEVWGGAGSLADLGYLGDFTERPERAVKKASLRYEGLLIMLSDEMESEGIASSGSKFIGDALRKGQALP